ncbi:MAG: hypothetical protein Q8Q47_09595 [Ignavibacteriaceae bacterium]|nr:hypothetical protein [Ignavibacteriaceae bacterium]
MMFTDFKDILDINDISKEKLGMYIKKTLYLFLLVQLVIFTQINCSSNVPRMTLIIFNDSYFEPTNHLNLKIYSSRIELPHKYIEIGTMKYEGQINLDELKKRSASRGADGLILDGNNYILIKFIEIKEQNDAHEII